MKRYPSILHLNKMKKHVGHNCYSFVKYDGSNLRFEWSAKNGFYKFGTRNRLFDHTDDIFGGAVRLFQETIAPRLSPIISKNYRNRGRAVVFCEYFGKNSFAGTHDPNDEKELVLFDVSIHRVGLLPPKDFLKHFGQLPFSAKLHYNGPLSVDYVNQIKGISNESFEGVIIKGVQNKQVWMTKVKTIGWLTKLERVFGNEYKKYV